MTRYDSQLGDRDPGTALRGSMSACVSDIRMPAGLLDRAVAQDRRRKARNRLAGAAGVTAAVTAAVVLAAGVPGQSAGRPGTAHPTTGLKAQDAAYLLNRAAVAQVNSYRMISVDDDGNGLAYTDVATQQQLLVSGLRASSGGPYFKIATAISGGAYIETDVEYQHHVWSTFTTSSLDNGVRVTLGSFLPLQGNPDPAVAFRQALKAGVITVLGHRSLHGRDTILIRVKSKFGLAGKPTPAGNSRAILAPPSLVWLDASTYLVVQTQHFVPHVNGSPGSPSKSTTWAPVVDHVTWLAPTPENLALLTVTPPAGFTKIPYSELAQKYLGPIS